jgi:hypothetical protein
MGNQSSSSFKLKIESEIDNEIKQSITNNCIATTNVSQIISIVGSGNVVDKVKQYGAIALTTKCAISQKSFSKIFSKISSAITAAYKKDTTVLSEAVKGLLGGKDDDKITNTIEKIFHNKISLNSVNNCIQTVNAQQDIYVVGNYNIVVGTTQEEYANGVLNCISQQISKSGVIDYLFGTQNVKSTWVDTTLKDIGGIVSNIFKGISNVLKSGLWGWVPAVIAIVVAIVAGIFLKDYFGAKKTTTLPT